MIRRIRRHTEEPAINLTPLIDIVFVILIMFIVVAPLLEMERIDLAQSPAGTDRVQPLRAQGPLTIQVKADNSIWLHDKKVTPAELAIQLRQQREKNSNVIPQLYQDQRAQFGTYQIVKNLVEAAGWSEMQLVLQPGQAIP